MKPVPNAVIGGSGLYQLEGLTGVKEIEVNTPFGKPSDAILVGEALMTSNDIAAKVRELLGADED